MNNPRKPHEDRERDIFLAVTAIEKGRSKTGETKLSFSAVAREIGVSPALIHNHYPKAAEHIRQRLSKSSRVQRNLKQDQLKEARKKNVSYREEIKQLRLQVAKLATLNEMLGLENQKLKAQVESPNIVEFKKT
ncbi:TetR family transcriptional regulator [Pseudomonas sp. CJQ_11]|uniref:TetR family transcriptional regulator n=1 Tax=Pseudomonas sp. CJQ_11 TaxID=3367169 RepID=UPI00370B4A61